MKTNFEKQTSKGKLEITIENGTATGVLAGNKLGTTGMVVGIPLVTINGLKYSNGIFGVLLTDSEAATIREALTVARSTEKGSRSQYAQTMREARGDINQFKNS